MVKQRVTSLYRKLTPEQVFLSSGNGKLGAKLECLLAGTLSAQLTYYVPDQLSASTTLHDYSSTLACVTLLN